MKQTLLSFKTQEFPDVHRSLQALIDALQSNSGINDSFKDELLDCCIIDIIQPYIPEYLNNISEYIAQVILMGGTFSGIGIKMASRVWAIARDKRFKNTGSLRNIIKKIPFLGHYSPDLERLLNQVLNEHGEMEVSGDRPLAWPLR